MSQQQVKEFASLIEKFNKKINLVSRKDIANLWSKHIEDGLRSYHEYLNNYRLPDEYSFYDLGSGNGIPGMIWAILSPGNQFFLVDTDERKCEFLKYVNTKLELNNVTILNQNFATISPTAPYIFLSRGLMSIQEFLLSESKFQESPGFFIKGSTWNNEIGHIPIHNFAYSDYSLDGDIQRSLVFYKGKSKK